MAPFGQLFTSPCPDGLALALLKHPAFGKLRIRQDYTMSIIKNFGFLWERQYIYRGRGKVVGHLQGKRKGFEADFREQIGVYILYDRMQRIVYVGQAGNGNATLFGRLKQHMDGSLRNRWEYFSWFGFRKVNSDGSLSRQQEVDSAVSGFNYSEALNQLEGILIEVIEPSFNKRRGKLQAAERYQQVIDGAIVSATNDDLLDELQALNRRLEKLQLR